MEHKPQGPKLTLLKGLRGRIEDIQRQMDHLEGRRFQLEHLQHTLGEIETQLRRMAALAREAAALPTDAEPRRLEALSREFESCKQRVELLSRNTAVNGEPLLADNLAGVRELIKSLDNVLREQFE